jgi:hypothetical protein
MEEIMAKRKVKLGEVPYELKVLIYIRPNLRDEALEFEIYLGREVLDGLFCDKPKIMPEVKNLVLSFPERWLNITEQRVLYERLSHYCPNLKTVQIKTHSPSIIQNTKANCCIVVDGEGSSIQEGSVDIKGKTYVEMVGNIFDLNKLNVIGG